METFTKGELEVMQILWAHGPQKPGEIEERFPREVGNAALRSMLLVLLEKGHVARQREGRAYVYRAVTPPQTELRRAVRRLADTFFSGSRKALIAQLIETEKLSPEDIHELRHIAERRIGNGRNGGSRR